MTNVNMTPSERDEYESYKRAKAQIAAQGAVGTPGAEDPELTIADVLKRLVHNARLASENEVRKYHNVIDDWFDRHFGENDYDENHDGVDDDEETDPVEPPAVRTSDV